MIKYLELNSGLVLKYDSRYDDSVIYVSDDKELKTVIILLADILAYEFIVGNIHKEIDDFMELFK